MASPQPVPSSKTSDRDLASMAEARTLARLARQAQAELAELSQERIDAIVDAMAAAVTPQCEALARLAVEETGYGVVADKVQKNLFSAERVYRFIRPMKTVGVIRRLDDRKIVEIAEPFGVVAAIVPSTNPTSTAIYKILIALKARCAIVISPHPSAVRCITRVAEIMNEAARGAGAPEGSINWMKTVTLEGTQELMKSRDVAVILATGGMGLVRAAYSSGKAGIRRWSRKCALLCRVVRRHRRRPHPTSSLARRSTTVCSALLPNSVVVDTAIAEELKREFVNQGAYFLNAAEIDAVTKVLIGPQRLPNPAIVGRPAVFIAEKAGLRVPPATRVLVAPLAGVGRDFPLSIEKLCPVLSWYVVQDWREGLRALQGDPALRRHGTHDVDPLAERPDHSRVRPQEAGLPHCGEHTHHAWFRRHDDRAGSGDDARVRRMGRKYHVRQHLAEASVEHQAPGVRADARRRRRRRPRRGATPARPPSAGLSPDVLGARIDQFLASRGISTPPLRGDWQERHLRPLPGRSRLPNEAAEFVCEDDVRQAVRAGQKILVNSRTIVTPAARDLGEEKRIFVESR